MTSYHDYEGAEYEYPPHEEEPLTNEEWLKSCNTNELAKFLSDATIDAFFRHGSGELPRINGTEAWTRWLKEKHDA